MRCVSKKDIKLPERSGSSRKGDNGSVLIVGGSKEFVGAVALAGLAALRSGVDGCQIAAPEKVAWAVNSISPDLVTKKLEGGYFSSKHVGEISKLAETRDVVLIGNGIGTGKETKEFVKSVIKKIKNPKVVDADGIKALSAEELENSVITPHIKELEIFMENSKVNGKIISRIVKEKDVERRALMIRKAFGFLSRKGKGGKKFFENNNVVLLKGPVDTIISGGGIYCSKTGNAGMSKGGTGDVLAGLAAGFLAQSKDLTQSAVNAAYYTGLAGDVLLKRKKGFTFLASDLAEEIRSITRKKQA